MAWRFVVGFVVAFGAGAGAALLALWLWAIKEWPR